MAKGSKFIIYAALSANLAIAVVKFGAAFITGSSAMLSEAIHSTVDSGNQLLLLYGFHQAKKKADSKHPFGYARELYFWAFVVSIMIFAVGGGVSLFEGIKKIIDPHPIDSAYLNYIVLVFSMVFECMALVLAVKEFNKIRGKQGFIRAVLETKDPSTVTVILEDSAALLGLSVAFIGIVLSQALNLPIFDGIASVVIGCILIMASIILAVETKGLLIGEAALPQVEKAIRSTVCNIPGITGVNQMLTMHLGPRDILVNLSVDFNDNLKAGDVEELTQSLKSQITKRYPDVKRIFIEALDRTSYLNKEGNNENSI